jgi:hypothetical protein
VLHDSVTDERLLREALQSFPPEPFQDVAHPSTRQLVLSGSFIHDEHNRSVGKRHAARVILLCPANELIEFHRRKYHSWTRRRDCGFVTIVVIDRTLRHVFASGSCLSLF